LHAGLAHFARKTLKKQAFRLKAPGIAPENPLHRPAVARKPAAEGRENRIRRRGDSLPAKDG